MKSGKFTTALVLAIVLALAAPSWSAFVWFQDKKVTAIRVQGNDAWFTVEGQPAAYYGFDPTTASGKNWLSVLIAAKTSGQKIEYQYDNATTRYPGTVSFNCYGVGLR